MRLMSSTTNFKTLFEQRGSSVSRRQNSTTTYDMVTLVLGIAEETEPRKSWSLDMVEKEHCMGLGIMFHLVLTIKQKIR